MAMDMLQDGDAEVVVAGGTEAAIHPLPMAAFANMQALSRRNDDPAAASRPYDVDRDGFVMGEGAGALVIETEEHAKARGATIYAELAGGGVTSDAHHITGPDPEGRGAARALRKALTSAGATEDVTHVNAHATSTPVGDVAGVHRHEGCLRLAPGQCLRLGHQVSEQYISLYFVAASCLHQARGCELLMDPSSRVDDGSVERVEMLIGVVPDLALRRRTCYEPLVSTHPDTQGPACSAPQRPAPPPPMTAAARAAAQPPTRAAAPAVTRAR